MRRGWAVLAAFAAAVAGLYVAELRGDRPLIDRRTCDEEPSSHTRALDGSQRGDALYRFVYGTLLGLGRNAPRAGFPHVDVGPVCTLGWKDPVAAIKIGPHIFLITFDGAHIASVKGSRARQDD